MIGEPAKYGPKTSDARRRSTCWSGVRVRQPRELGRAAHDREERRAEQRERARSADEGRRRAPPRSATTPPIAPNAVRAAFGLPTSSRVVGGAHACVSLIAALGELGLGEWSCAWASSSSPCAAAGIDLHPSGDRQERPQDEANADDEEAEREDEIQSAGRGASRSPRVPPGIAVTDGLRNSTEPSSGSSKRLHVLGLEVHSPSRHRAATRSSRAA